MVGIVTTPNASLLDDLGPRSESRFTQPNKVIKVGKILRQSVEDWANRHQIQVWRLNVDVKCIGIAAVAAQYSGS